MDAASAASCGSMGSSDCPWTRFPLGGTSRVMARMSGLTFLDLASDIGYNGIRFFPGLLNAGQHAEHYQIRSSAITTGRALRRASAAVLGRPHRVSHGTGQ